MQEVVTGQVREMRDGNHEVGARVDRVADDEGQSLGKGPGLGLGSGMGMEFGGLDIRSVGETLSVGDVP